MEEKELEILSQIPRQRVPDHLLDIIKSKLKNEPSTSWIYSYAAAAVLIIVCNVSIITHTPHNHRSMPSNANNPFTISNDVSYE